MVSEVNHCDYSRAEYHYYYLKPDYQIKWPEIRIYVHGNVTILIKICIDRTECAFILG